MIIFVVLIHACYVDHKGTWVNEIKDKILPIVGIKDLRVGMLFDLKEIECKLLNTLEQNWKAAVLCKPTRPLPWYDLPPHYIKK